MPAGSPRFAAWVTVSTAERGIFIQQLTLRKKIFGFLVGFCAILIAVLWLFQIIFLDDFYKFIKLGQIKGEATFISKRAEDSKLLDYLNEYESRKDCCVHVYDSQASALYHGDSRCVLDTLGSSQISLLIYRAEQNGGRTIDNFSGRFDLELPGGVLPQAPRSFFDNSDESIILTQVVNLSNGEERAFIFSSVISPVDATVSTLRIQLFIITGIMIFIALITSYFFSRSISEPIEDINKSAKILARGEYDTVFDADGYREIAELSNTLNYTASELGRVENLRREIIANVSHDLRTPLTLITGYSELMRDIPNENNRENAQIIVDETRRLTELVNDMLDLSKMQNGIELNKDWFNVTGMIKSTVERVASLVKSQGYIITFEYDRETTVNADELKISQAFYNFLINAINYTGEDKKVNIRQTISDKNVIIEVTDTGEGISEEKMPYIWERYYKNEGNHNRAVVGTGLGLSIVKNIIEAHGGVTGVRSKEGDGSTFWFSLPAD